MNERESAKPLLPWKVLILLLLGGVGLAAVLRLPLMDASPFHTDLACMLPRARAFVLGEAGVPFGEFWLYRPVILLATSGVLALMGPPFTPEKIHLAAGLATIVFTGLTAGIVGLWLHFRFRLRLPLVFAVLFFWLCLPAMLPFYADGLQTAPALFFGVSAFLAADLGVLRAGKRGAAALALLVGPFLLLAALSRDTFALLAFPCGLRLLQARGYRIGLLSKAFIGGTAATAAWLAMEALLFHPGHSLLELVPATGLTLNLAPSRLLDPGQWIRVGGILFLASGFILPVQAFYGLFRRGKDLPPGLPLLLWVFLFTVLQVMFFRPALRLFAPFTLPLLFLGLRALPLRTRPGRSALIFLVLALAALPFSLPRVWVLHRYPHDYHLRAERLGRLARKKDLVLFMGPDWCYGAWLFPHRPVVSFWNILSKGEKEGLVRSGKPVIPRRSDDLASLLRKSLVPVVRLCSARGGDVLVVPEPEQVEAFHKMGGKDMEVTVLEEIPPGGSIMQGDPFGLGFGLGDPFSKRKEEVLRLRLSPGRPGGSRPSSPEGMPRDGGGTPRKDRSK